MTRTPERTPFELAEIETTVRRRMTLYDIEGRRPDGGFLRTEGHTDANLPSIRGWLEREGYTLQVISRTP